MVIDNLEITFVMFVECGASSIDNLEFEALQSQDPTFNGFGQSGSFKE